MKRAWTAWFTLWVSFGVLAGSISSSEAAESSPFPSSATNQNVRRLTSTPVLLSPSLAQIVRMVRARLDPDVIRAYIKSSNVSYNPSAAEIVTLNQLGIPQELVTAILERDGELRTRRASQTRRTLEPADIAAGLAYNNLPAQHVVPPIRVNPPLSSYAFYQPPRFIIGSQVQSFNNSYPTVINGQSVYSGYFVPMYFW